MVPQVTAFEESRMVLDLQVLRNRKVIGMTTSGAARLRKLLQAVAPPIGKLLLIKLINVLLIVRPRQWLAWAFRIRQAAKVIYLFCESSVKAQLVRVTKSLGRVPPFNLRFLNTVN